MHDSSEISSWVSVIEHWLHKGRQSLLHHSFSRLLHSASCLMDNHKAFIDLIRELGDLQTLVSLSGKAEDLEILYLVVLQRRSTWRALHTLVL